MADHHLSIRMHGRTVADLLQDDAGRLWLDYLPEAAHPLSLSLPLDAGRLAPDLVEPYFGNLLPESEAAREAIARQTGANARNTFSLLRAIGRECAGAISLHDPDAPVVPVDPVAIRARVLEPDELARHLADLPRRPLLIGVDGLRLSLAGAQEKAAFCMLGGQLAVPLDGTPSTHILKPAHPRYPHMVENEHLSMVLAADVGLPVATTTIGRVADTDYLLIARFDRRIDAEGRLFRLHQEDFCQALGASYARKYQADGGPGLTECFAVLNRMAVPAKERLDFLRRLLFNVLIGNCDAHAKNHSVLYLPSGPTLTPVYDLVSTRYYPDLADRLAMNVGGENKPDRLTAGAWRRLCERTGVGFPLLRRSFSAVHKQLQTAIARRRNEGRPAAQDAILGFIGDHAARIHAAFEAQAGR